MVRRPNLFKYLPLNVNFSKFTFNALCLHRVLRICNSNCKSFSFSAINTISSAYKRIQIFSPSISIPESRALMSVTKLFINILNNTGQMTHFRTIVHQNNSPSAEVLVIHTQISKLVYIRRFWNTFHRTRSKSKDLKMTFILISNCHKIRVTIRLTSLISNPLQYQNCEVIMNMHRFLSTGF